jgi:hypothetical protein
MRTEFYQHYLRPQRLLHRLCGVALRSGPQFWYLTTARRPGQPGFGGAEKRELARFLPHVERVLELSWDSRASALPITPCSTSWASCRPRSWSSTQRRIRS